MLDGRDAVASLPKAHAPQAAAIPATRAPQPERIAECWIECRVEYSVED